MNGGRPQLGVPGLMGGGGPYARAPQGGGGAGLGQLGSALGEKLAPLMMSGIKGLKARAMNEGSDKRAEDDAEKYHYLQNDPELLQQFLKENEYYQKKPQGLKYLQALLQKGQRVSPETLSPQERTQWQGRRGQAAFGGLSTGGQPFAPGQPGLQTKATQAIAPHMAGMGFPQERYTPTGIGGPEAKAFWEKMTAAGVPRPTTSGEAATTRVKGGAMAPVPSNYNEWIKGKDVEFEQITDANEKALSGFLTMGPAVFANLPQEPDDLLFEYKALLGDKDLLNKLGVPLDKEGEPDLKAWNNAVFEAKTWEEKLNAYLHLITAVPLNPKARQWIYFNWLGGGPQEPFAAKRPWETAIGL